MYYSITFVSSANQKNTWDSWRLIPSTPPVIEPPMVSTNFVEIPGGIPIDVSDWISGKPTYSNSEGSWSFILADDTMNRARLYQEMKAFLHGKSLKIYLEEDPGHYYIGRFSVAAPQTGETGTAFGIDYTISPVRYKLDGTKDGI